MPRKPRFEPDVETMKWNRKYKFSNFKGYFVTDTKKYNKKTYSITNLSNDPYWPFGGGLRVTKKRYNKISRDTEFNKKQVKNMLNIRKKRR